MSGTYNGTVKGLIDKLTADYNSDDIITVSTWDAEDVRGWIEENRSKFIPKEESAMDVLISAALSGMARWYDPGLGITTEHLSQAFDSALEDMMNKWSKSTVRITVTSGVVEVEASCLPKEWSYCLLDLDTEEGRAMSEAFEVDPEPNLLILRVSSGVVEVDESTLPDGYKYTIVDTGQKVLEKDSESKSED